MNTLSAFNCRSNSGQPSRFVPGQNADSIEVVAEEALHNPGDDVSCRRVPALPCWCRSCSATHYVTAWEHAVVSDMIDLRARACTAVGRRCHQPDHAYSNGKSYLMMDVNAA